MPKNLLLPSARSGVLVKDQRPHLSPWWRRAAVLGGLIAILVGGADALARVSERYLGEDVVFTAFAPAATLFVPTPLGEVEGAAVEAFIPARLIVPAISVDAKVERVGKTSEGAMATPSVLSQVGWYELGKRPGEEGSAVFAGHVNNAIGLPGVFKKLSEIKKGDTVTVQGSLGEELTYVVEEISVYPENDAPLEQIFASEGPPSLVLITCEGAWDEQTRTFDKRLVVVARLQTP